MNSAVIILSLMAVCVLGNVHDNVRHANTVGEPEEQCTSIGQLIPDSTNCMVFYECDSDLFPRVFICDPETCFYQPHQKCEYKSQYDCGCTNPMVIPAKH